MKKLPTYKKVFEGYRIDSDVDTLPRESGVYMIYRCVFDKKTNSVDLKELFYIGKASDLLQEVKYHKRREEFLAQARDGEVICYSFALVNKLQYDIIENSLIFMQKPRLNNNLTDSYDHQDAVFHFSGACDLLKYKDYKIENGVVISL